MVLRSRNSASSDARMASECPLRVDRTSAAGHGAADGVYPTLVRRLAENEDVTVDISMSQDKVYKICVQCSNSFYVTAKDLAYFASRNLVPPKRCYACRKNNRAEAAKQISEQTVESDPSVKKSEFDSVWDDPAVKDRGKGD
jgi:hypothetical protein